MQSLFNFLNSAVGIITIQITFVSLAGGGGGLLVKKACDVLGFYSSPKRKEYIHNIAELLSYIIVIIFSAIILKFNMFLADETAFDGYSFSLIAQAVIYGSAAIAFLFLVQKGRILKIITAIRGKSGRK